MNPIEPTIKDYWMRAVTDNPIDLLSKVFNETRSSPTLEKVEVTFDKSVDGLSAFVVFFRMKSLLGFWYIQMEMGIVR